MERSIEDIWEQGFLKNDALLAPKLTNLYNKKSIHIIDKFKRMFKINLIAVTAFSFIFLIISSFLGIQIIGIVWFIVLMVLVMINKKLLIGLNTVDKGENSYQYLKAFNEWIKMQISINKRIATFMYPLLFISIIFGFWFKDLEGILLGEKLLKALLIHFPDLYLISGIPLIGIAIVFFIVGLLAFFGGRIYQWDLNLVYGRVFKKLDELLTDLESLRG